MLTVPFRTSAGVEVLYVLAVEPELAQPELLAQRRPQLCTRRSAPVAQNIALISNSRRLTVLFYY